MSYFLYYLGKPTKQVIKPPDMAKAMTSFGADGGIVSTSEETMVFLKAFFNGYFFPEAYFSEKVDPVCRITLRLDSCNL